MLWWMPDFFPLLVVKKECSLLDFDGVELQSWKNPSRAWTFAHCLKRFWLSEAQFCNFFVCFNICRNCSRDNVMCWNMKSTRVTCCMHATLLSVLWNCVSPENTFPKFVLISLAINLVYMDRSCSFWVFITRMLDDCVLMELTSNTSMWCDVMLMLLAPASARVYQWYGGHWSSSAQPSLWWCLYMLWFIRTLSNSCSWGTLITCSGQDLKSGILLIFLLHFAQLFSPTLPDGSSAFLNHEVDTNIYKKQHMITFS